MCSSDLQVQGISDLTYNGLKFSGNAQRRKRNCILFHGTFLLGMDLNTITHTLQVPDLQPDYREYRPHTKFLDNLPIQAHEVKHTLIHAWQAFTVMEIFPQPALISCLVDQQYRQDSWNARF